MPDKVLWRNGCPLSPWPIYPWGMCSVPKLWARNYDFTSVGVGFFTIFLAFSVPDSRIL